MTQQIGGDLSNHSTEPQSKRIAVCRCCDLVSHVPILKENHKASCPRCGTTLRLFQAKQRTAQLLYASCGLVMFALACLFPLVSIQVKGIFEQIYLLQVSSSLVAEQFYSLAFLFVGFVLFIPLFSFIAVILVNLEQPWCQHYRPFLLKWLFRFKSWCMGEIFLTGILVSFVKLIAYGQIGVGLSFVPYCLCALIQVLILNRLDRADLWSKVSATIRVYPLPQAGYSGLSQQVKLCDCCHAVLPLTVTHCSRCGHKAQARRTFSTQATLALLLTSFMLYIPANILPVMLTNGFGGPLKSTILSGVALMWYDGSYFVSMVIFIASIMIPILKMIALCWLCYLSHRPMSPFIKRQECLRGQFVYELLEIVGRWSMIDVFVIGILTTLIQVGVLMSITPQMGIVLFASVVLLTMVASLLFDMRLIWDRLDDNPAP